MVELITRKYKISDFDEFKRKILINRVFLEIVKVEYKNDGYFYITLHAPENELLKLENLGYKPIS